MNPIQKRGKSVRVAGRPEGEGMRSAIQVSLAALLLLSGCAREPRSVQNRPLKGLGQTVSEDQPSGSRASRLESVTWNPVKHELTWVVSSGAKEAGSDYKPAKSESYLIALDDATMSYSGEMRKFSTEEASNVHVLMDLIEKYAIDSTVWWDDGQGQPVDGGHKAKDKGAEPAQDPDDDDRLAVLRASYVLRAGSNSLIRGAGSRSTPRSFRSFGSSLTASLRPITER
jgi:hypothetical protein